MCKKLSAWRIVGKETASGHFGDFIGGQVLRRRARLEQEDKRTFRQMVEDQRV